MEQVTVENFRCFREKQTARLAPLTLLVGDNSTGKTSFLALVRALWDIGYRWQLPDFKEDPYDLGSFDELANRGTIRNPQPEIIQAGFTSSLIVHDSKRDRNQEKPFEVGVLLSKKGITPAVNRLFYRSGKTWIEEFFEKANSSDVRVGTHNGSWQWKKSLPDVVSFGSHMSREIPFLDSFFDQFHQKRWNPDGAEFIRKELKPINNSPPFTEDDWNLIVALVNLTTIYPFEQTDAFRLFVGAPVRSKPRRTYDPSLSTPDPQGDHVPMYLAKSYFQDNEKWILLKDRLERFGQSSGLFDEISIKPLGHSESNPFQVQVRKFSDRAEGLQQNLIDVGYGVSQVLPVVIELLHEDVTPMFLLQQPEVHLHPSAQAALGSFFCETASWDRQLIVETHSDYLQNRVRMDVCEGKGQLKPEDVSILFFERVGLDVRIHSIRIDNNGNIVDQPSGYRQFFSDEMRRSLRV